ncbi:deoxyribodipyrimidine photo-lyase, partial [Xylella fastidiosa]|nr:deoxyribodipyrimidine photo-lyase [Xylella fastidiosa subsp. multiplex]
MLPKALIWLRRDLRLEDHTPLAHAEQEGFSVALAFVFDRKILQPLPAT